MFSEPVTYFKSLGRKITKKDLVEYYNKVFSKVVTNPQIMQDVFNNMHGDIDSFQEIMKRNNKINDRVRSYLMSIAFEFKEEFYCVYNIKFKPFSGKITLGSGANVKVRIEFRKCKLDPKGNRSLIDSTYVQRSYKPFGKSLVIDEYLLPAVIGSNQTSGIYNQKYNGGYITSTSSDSNFPVPARLKISIVTSEGIPRVFDDSKTQARKYKSELKITIPEGTSQMSMNIIKRKSELMIWEKVDIMYFTLKKFAHDNTSSVSLKFNSLVFLGYLNYLHDQILDNKTIDKISLVYPFSYLDEVIKQYKKYNMFIKDTITDAMAHVEVSENNVVLQYPILQYINYTNNLKIPKKHLLTNPNGGEITITPRNKFLLKRSNSLSPLDYIFRYMSPLQTGLDVTKISQSRNNIEDMITMLLLRVSGNVFDERDSEDRDHWINRRLETVDDKIVLLFKREITNVIRDISKIPNEKKINFQESFIKSTSRIKESISSISKRSYGGSDDSGGTKDIGYYVNNTLSNRNVVGTYTQEVVVETDPEKTTKMKMRILHSSGVPFIDKGHTPSDKKTGGLIRHLSCLTRITEEHDIISELKRLKAVVEDEDDGQFRVVYNNITVAYINNTKETIYKLVQAKSLGVIHRDLSIYERNGDIVILSINGLPTRPCINVSLLLDSLKNIYPEKDDLFDDWDLFKHNSDLWRLIRNHRGSKFKLTEIESDQYVKPINSGIFEYINTIDQNMRLINLTIFNSVDEYLDQKDRDDFDDIFSGYCEIHPAVSHSLTTNSSPFFNHKDATRTNYFATQDRHKLEQHRDALPLAKENAYSRFTTLPLLRTPALSAFGNPCVGFLSLMVSGSYHGVEQEDHYVIKESSMYKISYDYAKNENLEFTFKHKPGRLRPHAIPTQYTNGNELEYNKWLEENNITSSRYNMDSYPITIKEGTKVKYGDVIVVFFKHNEESIGSGSGVFHGDQGIVTSVIVETSSKQQSASGHVRYTAIEYFAGHAAQKLSTNQAQKATVASPAKNLKGYIIDGKLFEADISMSGENVNSRGTPSLIIEGYLIPILLHLGVSLNIPNYARLSEIHDLVKIFPFWKKVLTAVPINPIDSDRQFYVKTKTMEYPFMLQMFVLAQDGVKKGSVSEIGKYVNDTSGDAKKGGDKGGLTVARMDTNAIVSVKQPTKLIEAIYADPEALNIRYTILCKRCKQKAYVVVNNINRDFEIKCTMCKNKEKVKSSGFSRHFVRIRSRNHVNNSENMIGMIGINKVFHWKT